MGRNRVKMGKNFITENRGKGVVGNGLEALGEKGLSGIGGGGRAGKNLITWRQMLFMSRYIKEVTNVHQRLMY
ncbi:hypothetical protein EKO25_23555 [Bacillus sp. SAJ1]|nr:hypothetical protein EKO25_23555 [Bacillus sp. SAJ1]